MPLAPPYTSSCVGGSSSLSSTAAESMVCRASAGAGMSSSSASLFLVFPFSTTEDTLQLTRTVTCPSAPSMSSTRKMFLATLTLPSAAQDTIASRTVPSDAAEHTTVSPPKRKGAIFHVPPWRAR